MVHRIEYIVFVIWNVGSRFVIANCNTMIMSRTKFTTKSNVVNACIVFTKIRWEMQRQMVHRRKLNWPVHGDKWIIEKYCICQPISLDTHLIGYSISPFGFRSTSNSSSGFAAASSNDIFGRFLKSRTLFGWELSLAPIIVMPLSLILPVNGMLNSSSSSASLSTN